MSYVRHTFRWTKMAEMAVAEKENYFSQQPWF